MRAFVYFFLLVVTAVSQAAPPANDGLFPCGGNVGSSVEVSLSGKADPWPPKFWCSNPGVTFDAGEKSPAVTINIASDAKPGPCLIRTWNDEGSSEPFLFLVGDPKEKVILELEKEQNRSLEDAQVIPPQFPAVIYGRLNPTKDVDCYKISLQKGQTLFAYLEGYTFRNGIDSMLHIYDTTGTRLDLVHDSSFNQDPQLVFKAPANGDYIIAVMAIATPPSANVSFHGGTKCSYRINLALKEKDLPKRLLPVNGKPDADLSKPLAAPFDIYQTLSKPNSTSTVLFTAKAKQKYQINVLSSEFRFPTDPVFSLYKPNGSLVKEIDDAKRDYPDSGYLFTASVDGDHKLEIKDRFRRGGPDFRFHLSIGEPQVEFSATADKSKYVIEAGKETSIKVKLTRTNGHKEPLTLEVKGLPKSVSIVEEPKVPEKSGDVTVKLKAGEDTPNFSGAFRLALKETNGSSKIAAFTFQDNTTFAPFLIDEVEDLWLTVKAKK